MIKILKERENDYHWLKVVENNVDKIFEENHVIKYYDR